MKNPLKNLMRNSLGPATLAVALSLLAIMDPAAVAQKAGSKPAKATQGRDFSKVEIDVIPVRGNVYMLVGAGGNVTVQVGEDGVVLVDTMFAELSDKILAAVAKLSDQPVRYIINTHVHPDHIGGNAPLAASGSSINGGNVNMAIQGATIGAAVISHENVLTNISNQEPPPPFEGWPTSTYFNEQKDLFLNGEAVQIIHQPHAHTDGDSVVFFRRSDVISTGDIFTTTMYPFIDVKNGGTIQGIIDALNRIIDLTVPERNQEGGTLVIPGHGRLCDESEVVEYRDMVTIIRDYIAEMIKEGRSLQDVQKARPTQGYDVRYGADSGFWTTTQFVEAIYNELKSQQ
jgi:glyoxylase-like metal-dependent hydrolase (beta-lactamase superfamily II)